MTMLPFKGRCHTCGHDHDHEAETIRDVLDIIKQSPSNTEQQALVKDAARYRWLRAQHWDTSKVAVVMYPKKNITLGSYCPFDHLLDELIDEEMTNAKP